MSKSDIEKASKNMKIFYKSKRKGNNVIDKQW